MHSILKNVSVLTLGALIAQGVNVASTPVIARLFSPANYGAWSTFISISLIVSTILTLAYPIKILVPESDEEAGNILSLSVAVTLLTGAAMLLMTSVIAPTFFKILGIEIIERYKYYLIICGIFGAIINIFNYHLNRKTAYKSMVAVRVTQVLAISFLSILFGYFQLDSGLIYAQIIGIAITFILIVIIAEVPSFTLSPKVLIATSKLNKSAPLFLFPTAVLDVLTMQLPFVAVGIWFAEDLAGQYRMAYALMSIPSAVFGGAISQVFFKEFSDKWPDKIVAKNILFQFWKILMLLGSIPFIIVLLFGQFIFEFILGPSWAEAGIIASIISPMIFFSLVHSPTSTTLIVMGYERMMLWFGLSVLIYRPVALFIGYILGDLYIGLALFVVLEIVQILAFQLYSYKKITNFSTKGY